MAGYTSEAREESFIRALQSRLDADNAIPIYYDEARGKFTSGGLYVRIKEELGIIS